MNSFRCETKGTALQSGREFNSGAGAQMDLSLAEKRLRIAVLLLAFGLLVLFIAGNSENGETGEDGKPSSTSEVAAYFHVPEPQYLDVDKYPAYIFVDGGAPISILRRHHYTTHFIPLPTTFGDQQLRVALWDNAKTPTAVFAGSPGFTELGRKDFLAWVSAGRNAVFTGGYSSLTAMNQIFGFELEYVPYREGPYWRNDRNVRGTPFEYAPSRIEETGAAYGVRIESIPLTGYSMYDTNRDSLVFYIKYNQGTVCYVGASFGDLDESDIWGVVLRAAVRM